MRDVWVVWVVWVVWGKEFREIREFKEKVAIRPLFLAQWAKKKRHTERYDT